MMFGNSYPTIAVLSDKLHSDFFKNIIKGIIDAAAKKKVNVIVVSGGAINQSNHESRNPLYDLISSKTIDGIISPSSSLGRYVSDNDYKIFLNKFSGIPIVSIGRELDDIPTIRRNTYEGEKILLRHLIKDHKYRRIAYVRSVKNHEVSEQRIRAYIDILKEYNIQFDPSLVIEKKSVHEFEKKLFPEFLKKSRMKFDAIVADNPTIALSIIDEFKKRGYSVPRDIAVVSHEDIIDGIFIKPKLSALKDNAYLQGRKAAELIINMIKGKKLIIPKAIDTELLIRESCGCQIKNDYIEKFEYAAKSTLRQNRNRRKDDIYSNSSSSIMGSDTYLAELADSVKRMSAESKKISKAEIIKEFRNFYDKSFVYSEYLIKKMTKIFANISENLTFNIKSEDSFYLINKIFDINFCYISLYEDKIDPDGFSRLILTYNNEHFHMDLNNRKKFRTRNLLPAGKFVHRAPFKIIIEPLNNIREQTGFIIFDLGIEELSTYELLQSLLSTSIQNELQQMKINISEDKMVKMAYFDSLTNLPNRTLFNDRLKHAISNAHRDKNNIGVVLLDIDHFKDINENLGNSAGDKIIKKTAERLLEVIRSSDTAARFGNDEFILILSSIKKTEDIVPIIEKIKKAFSIPFRINNKDYYITFSIGVSIFPNDGKSADNLLQNAEMAIDRAKKQGGNKSIFFDSNIEQKGVKRLMIINRMRNALLDDEFVLYFQPQIHASTTKIIGLESLIRWVLPEGGIIPPMDFIPIAEENGLIIPIGEWVLNRACEQIKEWKTCGFTDIKVAVNVSARQFTDPELVRNFYKIIKSNELEPSNFELEITENAIIENQDIAIKMLHEFKEIGMSISLDDFGTGYSSLSYLHKLPIDIVKIDKSFISSYLNTKESSSIIKTIISLVKDLNLQVIAEGVETREQLAFLRTLGCDTIQGYLFSKPLPSLEILNMLKEYYFNKVTWVESILNKYLIA